MKDVFSFQIYKEKPLKKFLKPAFCLTALREVRATGDTVVAKTSQIYRSLYENVSNAHFIYDLSKYSTDEFIVSAAIFKS